MTKQSKEEIPGYVTTENYDILRNNSFKEDKKKSEIIEALELRVKDLEKDLQKALFIKADAIAKEMQEQEHQYATNDSNIITNAIMDLRKLLMKPHIKVHKIRIAVTGNTIMEVQYET